MVFIPEGDDVVNERGDSGLCDGGSFCVSADVFDNLFGIAKFFPNVDVPIFGAGVSFVQKHGVEINFARFGGFPQHGDNLIAPSSFEYQVVKVGIVNPFGFAFGKPTARDEEMDMWIEFKIASKSVNDGHNGGGVAEFFAMTEDHKLCCLNQDVEAKFTVGLNDDPKDAGNGKDDVLVGDIEKVCLVFFDPVVGLERAATRAKPRFTSEVDVMLLAAGTLKYGIPETDFAQ